MACEFCGDLKSVSDPNNFHETVKYTDLEDLFLSSESGCSGCQVLFKSIQFMDYQFYSAKDIKITVFLLDPLHIEVRNLDSEKSILYPFSTRTTSWSAIPVCVPKEPIPLTLRNASIFIKAWLSHCFENHDCRIASMSRIPTRLIDVGDADTLPKLYITQKHDEYRYAALSHCWGPPNSGSRTLMTTKNNLRSHCSSISRSHIPQTFWDAIRLVRHIGLKYIWIDSLCIVQDDESDWTNEANLMADVYANAFITLSADSAAHSNCGLFPQAPTPQRKFQHKDETGMLHDIFVQLNGPQDKYSNSGVRIRSCYSSENISKLDNRAWVLQERVLARRIAHFGNAELIWECDNTQLPTCQCGNSLPSVNEKETSKEAFLSMLKINRQAHGLHELARQWQHIVEDYTRRQLTYVKDRLPAIAGLARKVPLPEGCYVAGMWTPCFGMNLSWYNAVESSKGRIAQVFGSSASAGTEPQVFAGSTYQRMPHDYAPTWSWASVAAPVVFSNSWHLPQDWAIVNIRFKHASPNPYGSVRHAALDILGYLIPVEISDGVVIRTECDENPTGNQLWPDVGPGSMEWRDPSFNYFVLPTELKSWNAIGLVLRTRKNNKELRYTRVGFAELYNWKLGEWKNGRQRQRVCIV